MNVPLSRELISQFAKITKEDKKPDNGKTVYGKVVEYEGAKYVKLDGSDLLTPVESTTNIEKDERVTVLIKNHTATVTGNITSPSARSVEVVTVSNAVGEFDKILANKASISELEAVNARIDDLDVGDLTAVNAEIENLKANKASIEQLNAVDAKIENLDVGDLTAVNAEIENLKANKLSAETADLKYANIDFTNIGKAAMEYFYATSGLIKDVTVGDQTITGNLVGVTISGDLIEGNTIKAEKLVVKGTDGLYYKLNTDGMKVEAEQTDQNSINGTVIKAKSITATKISVSDLVAFDATIGGFHIGDSAIYSGVKESMSNTTRGLYLGKDGQMYLGDANTFLKYYQDTDGTWKLSISADSIRFGAGRTSVATEIEDVKSTIDGIHTAASNAESAASSALTKATNAEREAASLSVEIDEIRSIVGSQDGQTTFVQYEEPEDAEVGDLWMRTGAARWMTFLANTWGEIGEKAWGGYFNANPATYIWDGEKWQLVADQAVVKEQNTQIQQTKEQISLMATKTELTAAEERIFEAEQKITPEAITSTVTSSTKYKNDLAGAVSDANADTDEKLKNYPTTVEMNSAITQKADSITSTVSATYATKAQAEGYANGAVTQANSDTDEKLKNYSTTTQMNSAIEQKANSITSTVSTTYATKTQAEGYANAAKTDAISSANSATDQKLKNYSTTTQMNSAIEQKANSITSTVSETYSTKAQAQGYASTAQNNAVSSANAATDEKLKNYSTTTQMNSAIDQRANSISLRVEEVAGIAGATPTTVKNSSVVIDTSGVAIKTGGTFTVDSKKFDINANGEMSATNAIISGKLQVDGQDVWNKGDLVVSTVTPSNPKNGMIWVKPDMSSIPAAGTWTHGQLDARPFKSPYDIALTGTSIGAAPSNATYTYTVSIPIYHSFNSSTAYNCTVYLGASSGAQTINMGTKSISKQGSDVYTFSTTSSTWLGNSGTIYMRVVFSNNLYVSVDSYAGFSCTLTAKSTSAGSGWKNCTVQMYIQ